MIIKKIKTIARNVNAVALAGAIAIGGMGLMSFVDEKEEVEATSARDDVTYGVIEGEDGKLYITDDPVDTGDIGCDLEDGHCKVTFSSSEASSIIQTDAGGQYVLESDSRVTTSGQGPYSN